MKEIFKETIFFICTFMVIYLSSLGSATFRTPTALAFMSILATGIIVLIFALLKMRSTESFHVSPPRQLNCMLGPSMIDEEERKYCAGVPPQELCKYGCSWPYQGRPYPPFKYTPLSDENWENHTEDMWK